MESEKTVGRPQDDGRAVAVVDVEVDDDRPSDRALAPERPDGDGHVVEQAEPLAVSGERVVETAAEVGRRRQGRQAQA